MAATDAMAFSKAVRVRRWLGRRSFAIICMTSSPVRRASSCFFGSLAATSLAPIGDMPSIVTATDIVLAVNWPPHAPAPGQAVFSRTVSRAELILPAACAPTASKTSWMVTS